MINSSVNVAERLLEINDLDQELFNYFQDKLLDSEQLSRTLVSFQGNKNQPVYRWYKYKEGFSVDLIVYLLEKYGIKRGKILDPFAGSGTTLFAAAARGLSADGIELLPIGQELIITRQILENGLNSDDIHRLEYWSNHSLWQQVDDKVKLLELPITQGAYPQENQFGTATKTRLLKQENERVQAILKLALLSILESISYTRKDGQYLRWDYRSGKQQGKNIFDKGKILDFKIALHSKLREILADLEPSQQQLELFSRDYPRGKIQLYQGSCLEILPEISSEKYNSIITSPPYCNRYDYTRIYALELALLGIDQLQLKQLRQQMLSCTVENKPKELLKINEHWSPAIAITDRQKLLESILGYLEELKSSKALNNHGIPRMIRGYFLEMSCLIYECFRVMKSSGIFCMINDNVRYAGASISVDLILSKIAEEIGFKVENILVVPQGKGNSSQQMGSHGRESLRKCIYVWRKP
ncbi:DNA methyltransferase [Microcystis aeruginosa]|uniref:DNA methyltransferase n=1 Tax=Microcystis aeruginosa TaxID=1126 RepID=UPI0002AD15F5|nr:DNA methyltransferase [Microcystis aeruginosa]ELS45754.1 modification methylase BsoBI [Microcystis aeruginosa FACHB-905 = DIANCHI905]